MTAEFYKDCEIFMTGGSGVVGKAAIEKLLRSCDVKKIYILLRTKKGISPEDRLVEIKNSRIFRVLKERKPNELDKLIPIPGDSAVDGLGISPEHLELMKNVSIVFHSAATTRFAEPLRMAIRLNLKSTLEALKIAETMPNLKIFIHVSSFFSNTHLKEIEDKVYPGLFDWRAAINLLDPKYDEMEPIMDGITNKVITSFPNTYIFTKHLAEQLVNDYRHKLPVGIFRPSIVIVAFEEPEPGYTDTMTGVMGLMLIWGTGLIKVLSCRKEARIDVTPLDVGTKTLLIFGARAGRMRREQIKEATPVAMFSSRQILENSLGEIGDCLYENSCDLPYEKSFWLPGLRMTACPFIYRVSNFFLQLVPALMVDFLLRIFRQKPFMMKIQRKLFMAINLLMFFLTSEFKTNGPTAYEELLKSEKGTEFDISVLENCCSTPERLNSRIRLVVVGCRKFLMNEDDSSLPRCRKILKAKMIGYNIIRCVALYFVGCAVYRRAMAYLSEWDY